MDDHDDNACVVGREEDMLSQDACLCCYDLNATLVDPEGHDEVRVDQSELVVSIRRDVVQLRSAAATGCQSCSFMVKALE